MSKELDESYNTLYAEFLKRFPEDMMITTFEGEKVLVKQIDFFSKVMSEIKGGGVVCFLHPDADTWHTIYKDGLWVNPGSHVRTESNDRQLAFTKENLLNKKLPETKPSSDDSRTQIIELINKLIDKL